MSIFVQPTIPHFGESKLSFDDAELMLHLRPDPRFVPIPGALFVGQLPVSATLGLGEVPGPWCVIGYGFLLAGIGRIAPYSCLFAMQEIREHLGVVYIGRSGDDRMDEFCAAVDADMGLHPEVPLVALARLAHLRVALFLLVLGGTGGADDAGINNSAPGYLQSVFLEVLIDQVEQLITQVVLLHQMAEFADRRFIGHRFSTQIDSDELAQCAGVIQGLFDSGIGQVEPVLDEVDSQHALNPDGTASCSLRFWIKWLDGLSQFFPGNNGFHLLQELFLSGFLAVLLETGIRKGVLAHGNQLVFRTGPIIIQHRNKSENP
jgi:hypothetical protein